MSPLEVIGVGARAPLGLRADAVAAACRAGISRHGQHPHWVDKAGEDMVVARDGKLDPVLPHLERMSALATSALQEALAPWKHRANKVRLVVYLALPEPRVGWSRAGAQHLAQVVRRICAEQSVPCANVVPLCQGHASGFLGTSQARTVLDSGTADVAIVLGVDSYIDAPMLEQLDEERRLANEVNRLGFTPGEGAGCLVLCSSRTRATLGCKPLARIVGVGTAQETALTQTDDVCTGKGLHAAVRAATASLRLPQQKIEMMYCDINGERYRSEEFMYLPLRLWGPFVDSNRYEAYADRWGDVGAASAPLLMSVPIVLAARTAIPYRWVGAWASSDGGLRGASVLEVGVSTWQ